MNVDFEPLDDEERDLRRVFERRPAPPGLKRKIMQRRHPQRTHFVVWQRLAATFALAAVLGGGAEWRHRDEQRRGEAARQQVLTALRITGHALDQMNAQLAAHGHAAEE